MGQMLSGYLKPLPFKNMRRLPLTLTVVPLLSSARSSECTETAPPAPVLMWSRTLVLENTPLGPAELPEAYA